MEPITFTPAHLERHDLVWTQMPLCRPESPEPAEYGAYLGNGTLGALVYAVEEPCDFPHHTVQVDVGRMDVADCGGTRPDGSEWWDKWGMRHKGTRLHTGGFRPRYGMEDVPCHARCSRCSRLSRLLPRRFSLGLLPPPSRPPRPA